MSESATEAEKGTGFMGKVASVYHTIEAVIGVICTWIFRLRKIVMAAPVLYWAIHLARLNMYRLPDMVGFNLQSTGHFAMLIDRGYAVYGPLALTVFCLVLMFCSRKTVFPWLISAFTLVVPYLIWYTNLFTGK